MFISQLVDFCLELIWLLFFDHFDISLGDFLDLSETRVREAISLQADIHQGRIFVQGFKHHCFNLFAEKVICELDCTDFFVSFQCIYQMNEAHVVETA